MIISDRIGETSLLVEEILNTINRCKLNHIPKDILNLKLVLTEMKAKFESMTTNRSLKSINTQCTAAYLDYNNRYLSDLLAQTKTWKGNLRETQEEDLKVILSKINTLFEFLEIVPLVPEDDLFSLEKSHPRWEALQGITETFHSDKAKRVNEKYKKFMGQIATGQAFVSKGYEEVPGIKRYLMIGLGSIYYLLKKKKALRKTNLLYAEPRIEVAIHVCNLLETKMIRKLMKVVIKSSRYDKIVYIPRLVSEVLKPYQIIKSQEKLSLTPVQDYVMARILNTINLDLSSPIKTYNKIVIHIHGGGFISMSSASHQVYTNVWCNNLQIPIISIDYRLAPKNPYPAALDDVWQTWNWIIQYGETIGINPNQYVIVGDSAGGNLALALTYKIIISGLPPPNGLVLAYPALNLDKNSFSPSLLFSLDDLLIPYSFLKLCLEAYLPEGIDIKNPMISPINIEKEVLEKFPMTRIMIGTEDPLYDECFRFAEKLLNCGGDIKISQYAGAAHGGLNYSFKGGIRETRDMVAKASEWMKEMLEIV
ncbi:hypothetical protein SteCoe_21156 [Stentor coeruleus]|uniref:Alpha/beta hydrolase fold-3 domain-containing protein n=1 Tax=Stentor coeruleus TaxID=5963 RepID=A0A1R2BQR5_9CILI|nr:hypothetical protein SteCoe_21156 [Stentor coeruleus]